MERRYIFFHTGIAFCVALLVIVCSAALLGAAFVLPPQIPVLRLIATIAICVGLWWIPDWLDYSLTRGRGCDGQ